MTALATRAILPGELHEDGLVLPPDLTFEAWAEALARAEWLERASPWWCYQIGECGKIVGRKSPRRAGNTRGGHQGVSLMRLDPTTLSPLPTAAAWWPRFAEKFDVAANGCWLWKASIHPHGYGRFGIKNRIYPAHRASYVALVGPIPPSLGLDHLCHTNDLTCQGGPSCLHRRCVNPEHLEPVTDAVNVLRGRSPMAQYARATHCKHGHPFSGDNLYRSKSGRHCKTCRLAANRALRARGWRPVKKPTPSQVRVLSVLAAGGELRAADWNHLLLFAHGASEPLCRVSTNTPASMRKLGWLSEYGGVTELGARILADFLGRAA